MTLIPVTHDTPDWHALRQRHVGGSEIAALFGSQPDYALSHFSLWHVKAGNAPPPEVKSVRAAWGLRLEAAIAEAAAMENGWQILKGGYVSDDTTPGLGCTLDWIIERDPAETGPGCLEVKNADWLAHKRSWTDDEPPLHILLQLQHQLACTGYGWGVVTCLVGGNDLRTYRYKARPKLIADIRRRTQEFWASIDQGREPPVDGSDSASAVLTALYPELTYEAADMGMNNEWAEAAHDFFNAGERRRSANKVYELAKNRIIALLGEHKRGYGNGWTVNCAVTPENPGRPPEPGELIGKRAEVRKYSVKETASA